MILRPPISTLFPYTALFRSEVINGLHPSSPPLGLIPLGTVNVLAIELGLPREPWAQAELIVDGPVHPVWPRSEEHTSELQSRQYLGCRLLLEKKNTHIRCR